MQIERERRKEEEVEALKRSMQGGMVSSFLFYKLKSTQFKYKNNSFTLFFFIVACLISQAQAMKEQAQLREEMAYQYKIGNFEVS